MIRVVTLLFCVCSFLLHGQTASPQIDIQVSLALPFNETAIADTSTSSSLISVGFGGGFTAPIAENIPIRVGFNIRHMWLGSESKNFNFVDELGDAYLLESKVRGSMTPVHAVVRIDPMDYVRFPVLPYVGGFGGMRFFGTNNKLTLDYQDGTEPIVDNNRKVSITTSYGFELGLHIKIGTQILLDFKYEHAYGGWAKYVDLSSVKIDANGNASYNRLETRTDVAMFSIGIVALLD